MSAVPGQVKVTKESWYAMYPGLDARIVARIGQWRDSVPVGTSATINKVMNCSADCGCSADGYQQSVKCKGSGHGMPMEIVLDVVFPEGGSCLIDGIKGISDTMPFRVEKTS